MKLPLSDVVLQAEPLLERILITLDADYIEIQVRTLLHHDCVNRNPTLCEISYKSLYVCFLFLFLLRSLF